MHHRKRGTPRDAFRGKKALGPKFKFDFAVKERDDDKGLGASGCKSVILPALR